MNDDRVQLSVPFYFVTRLLSTNVGFQAQQVNAFDVEKIQETTFSSVLLFHFIEKEVAKEKIFFFLHFFFLHYDFTFLFFFLFFSFDKKRITGIRYLRDACEACNSFVLHADDFTAVIRSSSVCRFSK